MRVRGPQRCGLHTAPANTAQPPLATRAAAMTSKAEASFVCKSFGANLLPEKAPEVGIKTVLKKKQVGTRGAQAGREHACAGLS